MVAGFRKEESLILHTLSGQVELPSSRRNLSSNPTHRDLFQERADSWFFGHGKPVAGLQAGVYVGFIAAGRCGSARDILLLQDEDSLLPRLELGCAYPGYVAGLRKTEDDLISFELWALEDGLDLQHGLLPVRAVF